MDELMNDIDDLEYEVNEMMRQIQEKSNSPESIQKHRPRTQSDSIHFDAKEIDNEADSLELNRLEKWNMELDNYQEGDLLTQNFLTFEDNLYDNLQMKVDSRWKALEDTKNNHKIESKDFDDRENDFDGFDELLEDLN